MKNIFTKSKAIEELRYGAEHSPSKLAREVARWGLAKAEGRTYTMDLPDTPAQKSKARGLKVLERDRQQQADKTARMAGIIRQAANLRQTAQDAPGSTAPNRHPGAPNKAQSAQSQPPDAGKRPPSEMSSLLDEARQDLQAGRLTEQKLLDSGLEPPVKRPSAGVSLEQMIEEARIENAKPSLFAPDPLAGWVPPKTDPESEIPF